MEGKAQHMANDGQGFAGVPAGQLLIAQRRHLNLDVDAVKQGAGDSRAVSLDLWRSAGPFFLGVGKKSASTRVH